MVWSPPVFSISAVMLQIPGALPLCSFDRACMTSSLVTGLTLQMGFALVFLAARVRVGSV